MAGTKKRRIDDAPEAKYWVCARFSTVQRKIELAILDGDYYSIQ